MARTHLKLQALILALLTTNTISAKDLGVMGQTFTIIELSLLEIIQTRLKQMEQEGKLREHQKIIQDRVKQSAQRPSPTVLPHGDICQSHLYDPTLVVEQDIVDHKNNVIAAKGTTINPLDTVSFGQALLFIDGDDEAQVMWGLGQTGRIVLVNGAPLGLAKQHNRRFYFDQGGALVRRFSISSTPARVSQQGKALLVEELNLESCR